MEDFEREEQQKKRKMWALAALPFSLVFCVWRLQMNPKAAPPPAAPAAVRADVAKTVSPAVAGLVKRVTVNTYGKDPFMPLVAFAKPGMPMTSVKVSAPPVRLTEIFRGGLPMPGGGMTGLRPFAPSPEVVPVPRPVMPVVAPAINNEAPARPVMPYTLTGVVRGHPDVAILRHQDGTRRVARAGDMLDGTYRLVTIHDEDVTVTGDGDRFELLLGAAPEGAFTPGNATKEAVVTTG